MSPSLFRIRLYRWVNKTQAQILEFMNCSEEWRRIGRFTGIKTWGRRVQASAGRWKSRQCVCRCSTQTVRGSMCVLQSLLWVTRAKLGARWAPQWFLGLRKQGKCISKYGVWVVFWERKDWRAQGSAGEKWHWMGTWRWTEREFDSGKWLWSRVHVLFTSKPWKWYVPFARIDVPSLLACVLEEGLPCAHQTKHALSRSFGCRQYFYPRWRFREIENSF